jgi:hypothetical protein
MDMKNTGRQNIIDQVLDEYVPWGGPIVQRRVLLSHMREQGFDARAIDFSVFGREAVPAPENPEWHLDFFRQTAAL